MNISKWAGINNSEFSFYFGYLDGPQHLSNNLKAQVSDANKFMLDTLKALLEKFESGNYDLYGDEELEYIKTTIDEKHNSTLERITQIMLKFELFTLTKDIFRY